MCQISWFPCKPRPPPVLSLNRFLLSLWVFCLCCFSLSASQNVLFRTLPVFALCSAFWRAFWVSLHNSACNCMCRLIAVQCCRRSCCILTFCFCSSLKWISVRRTIVEWCSVCICQCIGSFQRLCVNFIILFIVTLEISRKSGLFFKKWTFCLCAVVFCPLQSLANSALFLFTLYAFTFGIVIKWIGCYQILRICNMTYFCSGSGGSGLISRYSDSLWVRWFGVLTVVRDRDIFSTPVETVPGAHQVRLWSHNNAGLNSIWYDTKGLRDSVCQLLVRGPGFPSRCSTHIYEWPKFWSPVPCVKNSLENLHVLHSYFRRPSWCKLMGLCPVCRRLYSSVRNVPCRFGDLNWQRSANSASVPEFI